MRDGLARRDERRIEFDRYHEVVAVLRDVDVADERDRRVDEYVKAPELGHRRVDHGDDLLAVGKVGRRRDCGSAGPR